MAASGKSSVSNGIASALNIPYVSSGLLYRAVTYLHTQANKTEFCAALCDELSLETLSGGNKIWNGSLELTHQLHSSTVDDAVSFYAAQPVIREWINTKLQQLKPPFVAEGRDMGTTVFPHADHKFYLIASAKVRAQRRSAERPEEIPAIEAALIRRDRLDQWQSAPAADALVIDTTTLQLSEVIDLILQKSQ